MKIVEKNVGTKIDYEVSGTKITFADELMLNPVSYTHLDVYKRQVPLHPTMKFHLLAQLRNLEAGSL